jgi:hypothetical protein
MAYNGMRLCEEAELEAQMFNLALNPLFCITPVVCRFFKVSSLSEDLGRFHNYFCFGLYQLLYE